MSSIIAYQGEPGAYSEAAARELFGADISTLPCSTFDDVFSSVNTGRCTHGVLPIENSLAGSIHRNYDLLLRNDLHIVAERHLRISHCLMALPGVGLAQVHRVHSHPQALAQCEASLTRLGLELVPEYDTAGSARLLRERNDRSGAAIASRHASEVYGLEILIDGLEDDPANFTRFLAASTQPLPVQRPEEGDYKTSIVFSLDNTSGVLFKALSVFALRDIDLTKIESRPLQGRPWEYFFYIDFTGHQEAANCRRALGHLGELAPFLRILGSYPAHRLVYPVEKARSV